MVSSIWSGTVPGIVVGNAGVIRFRRSTDAKPIRQSIELSRCSKLLSHWFPVQKFVQFYNSCSEHPVKCNMFKVSRSASVRYERRSPFPGLCTSCLLVLCTIVFIAVHVMFTYVFLCRQRFLTWNLFLRIMVMRRSSIDIWFILHSRVGNTSMITFWLSSFKGFLVRSNNEGRCSTHT